MCHIKSVSSVCVSSIDLVVSFSAHTCMSGCTCLFTFLLQIQKASLCTESKSQKSFALFGLTELAILTLADSKEGTAFCDFFYKLKSAAFMAFIHSFLIFYHSFVPSIFLNFHNTPQSYVFFITETPLNSLLM